MQRIVSVLGALLVAGGLAILAYVGLSYLQATQAAAPHSNHHQTATRHHLTRTHHAGRQQVTVPRRLVAAAPGAEPATRMVIPKIAIDAPVDETPATGGTWPVADWSVGHLASSPRPGQVGNGAYAAHDDIKGELFKRLGELRRGDSVFVYTKQMRYRYVVARRLVVDPSDVSVLRSTAKPTVTLITCTPYWVDTQRLVIQAVLKTRTRV
jgi:LPXTG-site transpeptidase (sortase) family protein